MSDLATIPGYTPSTGGETPPPEGLRGEGVAGATTTHVEFRHVVAVDGGGGVLVEETSGAAYAEATGAADRIPPDPPAIDGTDREGPSPAAAHAITPADVDRWRRPATYAAAFLCGALLAMLTRSSRRADADDAPTATPAAFAVPMAPVGAFDQTRDAGPEHMRDEDGTRWDAIDEGSDESFPASDPRVW